MDTSVFTDLFDEWTDAALEWVSDNGEFLFDYIRQVLEGLYDGILWLLELPPFYVVALIVALIGWRLVNVWVRGAQRCRAGALLFDGALGRRR